MISILEYPRSLKNFCSHHFVIATINNFFQVLFTILLDYVGELSQVGPEGIKMIDELSR